MSTAADTIEEAQFKLREIARPMWTDTRANSLMQAARMLGISPFLAQRIIYRKLKRIDAHVLDNIRAAYARLEAKAEAEADLQIARAKAALGEFHAATEEMDSGDDRPAVRSTDGTR